MSHSGGSEQYKLDSDENVVLINPRFPKPLREAMMSRLEAANGLSGHIFAATSGTTAAGQDGMKWAALSKKAVLAAAEGSNQFLAETSRDVWLHLLPDFHVGGMGIWIRSRLSGSRVIKPNFKKWDPEAAVKLMESERATMASMVPTQVHDLVVKNLKSPASMRVILVGGGALSQELYERARALGWPVLRSYGMTETASQAATEPLSTLTGSVPSSQAFEVLPHLEMKADSGGRLMVRGKSLLTGWIEAGADGKARFHDPKDHDGWLAASDYGEVTGRTVTFTGREADRIKVGGETVNLGALETRLLAQAGPEAAHLALAALPDPRLEKFVVLVFEGPVTEAKAHEILDRFHQDCLPFERVRAVFQVSAIPRSELGKIRRAELESILLNQQSG